MNDLLNRPHRRLPLLALLLALLPVAACENGAAETTRSDAHEAAEAAEAEAGHAEADVVHLDSAAVSLAGIRLGTPEAVRTTGLAVTGAITYDANRVSHIGPRTEGRIVALHADLGQAVRAGEALAVLESPEIAELRAADEEAEALERIAREHYEREVRLEAQGISSRKEVLEAQAELRRAEAAERSAAARLNALGAAHGSRLGSRFAVTAPFGGVVVARSASLGGMASPAEPLFTVADLSRVWIELDIFERDLARVAVGQAVDVSVGAYTGRSFPGRIVHLGEVLDAEKRTVRARVEIPNADRALKPGMFARASIRVGNGHAVLAVPQEAVQELEGRQVVFVPGARAGEFRAQPVVLGEALEDERVVVASGLAAGQPLVVAGAFALRSELAKGEIGEHGH